MPTIFPPVLSGSKDISAYLSEDLLRYSIVLRDSANLLIHNGTFCLAESSSVISSLGTGILLCRHRYSTYISVLRIARQGILGSEAEQASWDNWSVEEVPLPREPVQQGACSWPAVRTAEGSRRIGIGSQS